MQGAALLLGAQPTTANQKREREEECQPPIIAKRVVPEPSCEREPTNEREPTKDRERERVMAKYADQIADLAEKALVALQALVAVEDCAKAELNEDYGLFGSDETSLGDAEVAILLARYSAEDVQQRLPA
jgi:hypothetical protein